MYICFVFLHIVLFQIQLYTCIVYGAVSKDNYILYSNTLPPIAF